MLSTERRAKYIVVFDPLDGSSNIDVNISIGTIFGVLRRPVDHKEPSARPTSCVPGRDLLAAGYVLDGSSTRPGDQHRQGRRGCARLHATTRRWASSSCSHENLCIPERGKTYSINEGNTAVWPDEVRRWVAWDRRGGIAHHRRGQDTGTGRILRRPLLGTLVADPRTLGTLLKGGIFVYPPDRKNPGGKLRLLYEANPSPSSSRPRRKATTGRERILDIMSSEKLHQRTAGPRLPHDVDCYEQFMRGDR